MDSFQEDVISMLRHPVECLVTPWQAAPPESARRGRRLEISEGSAGRK